MYYHRHDNLVFTLWNEKRLEGRLLTNNIPKTHKHYNIALKLENDWEYLANWFDDNDENVNVQKPYKAIVDVYRSTIIPHNEPIFDEDKHTFHQTMCRVMLRFLLCAFDISNVVGYENVQQIINDYIQNGEAY